jgi:Pentapeptide repeats (8 copies)
MQIVRIRTERPESWGAWWERRRHPWMAPFLALEYGMEWALYALSNWRFLEVLEYLGSLGVLVAVVFYFAEAGDRLKQKHYQAWQVVNSAQGKGGNGGRIEALEELNADGVSLVGVNLSSAFLMDVRLPKGKLARANFDDSDARNAELTSANLEDASLRSANLRSANLGRAALNGSILDDADLTGADLQNTDLTEASLANADLREANLDGAKWNSLRSVKGANVHGITNTAFHQWALSHGAVDQP